MTQQFKLPDLGEGIHEAEILEVPISVGDEIEEDQIILTVETDKASVDIPSPFSGLVQDIQVEAGEIVHVGDVMLTVNGAGGEAEPEAEAKATKAGKRTETQKTNGKQPEQKSAQREKAAPPERKDLPIAASPDTRRIARELNVDLQQVEGSGPGGRVTQGDVRAFAEEGKRPPAATEAEETAETHERRAPAAQPPTMPELPDFSQWGPVERLPLRSVRRTTARRMAESWAQIPHVTHHDKADVTELEQLRQHYLEEMNLDSLTMLVFVMKAVAAALKKYPRFNASLDVETDEIILKHYYNLGIAVATERGLIVPVIRDVESKSLIELTTEMGELVERTRAGDIDLDEMQGGTFTITNVGPLGGTHFDPIINFPQAAILGMARLKWEAEVRIENGEKHIEPRYMLPLVLAFDHRMSDGADAARFVNDLISMLEDPDQFVLRL